MSVPGEVDVLVAGFGAAGASAAIAAHDEGATVAVVEKTSSGGGNCVHSGGFLFEVDGPGAVEHLDALCFGKTDRAVLDGIRARPARRHAVRGRARRHHRAGRPRGIRGNAPVLAALPWRRSATASSSRSPASGPAAACGACSRPPSPSARSRWRSTRRSVELVTEDDRVIGAIVERGGRRRRIMARGGVILASGGFEADPELRDTYLPLPLVSVGHQGNTGDTIRLAQAAGASLWHMSAFFGWLSFVHPDYPAGFTLDVHAPSFIYVDGDGRRFADETGWEVHDRLRALTAYLPRRPNRPRMPGWIVFDEAARLAGPLHGIVGSPNGYDWSPDNSAEVAAGWIKRGDDSAELAAATGLDPAMLQRTLSDYAAAVSERRDDEFGRAPATLVPLLPPLYAIQMTPGVATASGGPRRDAEGRVLRPGGAAIDGLYRRRRRRLDLGTSDRARRRPDRRDRVREGCRRERRPRGEEDGCTHTGLTSRPRAASCRST